jgi:hypothetical protein
MKIEKKQLSAINFINIIVLISYFIYRFRYPLPNFEINQFVIILEIFAIFYYFLVYLKVALIKEAVVYFLILLLLSLHLLIVETLYPSSILTAKFISMARLSMYLYVAYLFSKYVVNIDFFINKFIALSALLLIFTLVIHITGFDFFLTQGYEFPRQAFTLSEPSAYAPIVSVVLLYGILRLKYLYIFLALSSMLVINSGLSIVAPLLAAIILILSKGGWKIFGTALILLLILFFGLNYVELNSIDRIFSLARSFSFEDGSMGTARLTTFYNTFIDRYESSTLWIGTGFNTGKINYDGYEMYSEFSFLHFVFLSFGLLGLILYLVLVFFTLIRIVSISGIGTLYIFYLSWLFPALFNSAQGMLLWKFHLIIIFYIFLNKKYKQERQKLLNNPI